MDIEQEKVIYQDVLDNRTFEDLRRYGIEHEKDKNHNIELVPTSHKDSEIIEIYPKWILSAKKPEKQITLCKISDISGHPIPIIKFHWESKKLNIREDQVGIFILIAEKHGYIPAIISEISRSIYDDAYVRYLGNDGNIIQNLLIEILNN